jgi:hypothetical protein
MIQRFGHGAGHHALTDAGDGAIERRYEELARLRSPLSRFGPVAPPVGRTPNAPPEANRAVTTRSHRLKTFDFIEFVGGVDGTRTRGLRRDRPAF